MTVAQATAAGSWCILLHSHMPYVEGFGTWPFGEEWLLEAMASSYLPLLEVLERHAEQGARGIATVGVTPVLADQLALPEVGERFLRVHARHSPRVPHARTPRGLERAGQHEAAAALRLSGRRLRARRGGRSSAAGGDLLGALRALRDGGAIDLWASCATHAVLPLLATDNGVRMQVEAGVAAHAQRFGSWSGGFWLPECAYRPGVEDHLARAGVQRLLRRPDPRGRSARPPRADRRGRDGRACRSTGARSRSSGTTAATRRTRSTATTTRRRSTGCGRGRTAAALRPRRGARPGTRARRALRRAGHTSRDRIPGRAGAARPGRLRARHGAARPLVVRGTGVARRGDRRGRQRQGLALATLPAALARHEPRRRGRPGVDLGHRQGPAHLGLPAGRRRRLGRARVGAAARRRARRATARRRRAAPRGGPRASCWPCSRATGRS